MLGLDRRDERALLCIGWTVFAELAWRHEYFRWGVFVIKTFRTKLAQGTIANTTQAARVLGALGLTFCIGIGTSTTRDTFIAAFL